MKEVLNSKKNGVEVSEGNYNTGNTGNTLTIDDYSKKRNIKAAS